MVCTPGFIWGKLVKEAYNWWETGEGATFQEQGEPPGKLHRVWGFVGGLFLYALHVTVSQDQITADAEGQRERGGSSIYVVSFPRVF